MGWTRLWGLGDGRLWVEVVSYPVKAAIRLTVQRPQCEAVGKEGTGGEKVPWQNWTALETQARGLLAESGSQRGTGHDRTRAAK